MRTAPTEGAAGWTVSRTIVNGGSGFRVVERDEIFEEFQNGKTKSADLRSAGQAGGPPLLKQSSGS